MPTMQKPAPDRPVTCWAGGGVPLLWPANKRQLASERAKCDGYLLSATRQEKAKQCRDDLCSSRTFYIGATSDLLWWVGGA